ncbi:MAG: FG-GAP-like repeat-containing protein [Bacteroidota bacterium]|nr:FG-GAP-like repeat-containing protein [Bacteroidota bacterium]
MFSNPDPKQLMKSIPVSLFCLLFTVKLSAQTPDSLYNSNSFLPKMDVLTGIYPHSVVSADFNGDGKPDLFVARGSSNQVTVLTNTSSYGAISFAAPLYFPGMLNDMQGSAIGDLDGDGKPDVVVTNGIGDTSISVYRNSSSGNAISFDNPLRFVTNYGPYAVAIGDLDGDGKPDLAIANTGSNYITLYKNTSTPGSISFSNKTDLLVGTNPYGIAIGDLDKDGKAELVVSTEGGSSSLYVIKNTSTPGNFSFGSPVSYTNLSGAFTLAIGDLDGDGNPDITATGGYPGAILVLRNISTTGNLQFDPPKNFAAGNYTVDVSIRDLDGDAKPELVAVNRFGNSVSVLKNKSTVGNVDFENHMDYTVGNAPLIAAIADLDGDGNPDIITANSSSDKISILRNMIGDTVAPIIRSFTPDTAISGTKVTILGKHFTGTTAVQFGGVPAASFVVDSSSGITATVALGASGNLTVTTNFGTASDTGFIFKGPLIYKFTPTNGMAGDTIQISGTNFTGVTSVSFGMVAAASFSIPSDTSISAVLGTGASGDVSVSSSNGNASLSGFAYGGKPVILSFTPSSDTIGATITINGINFSANPDDNIVYFGPVRAIVKSATASRLQVAVPAGAVYDLITVTTNYLTAYSSLPFSAKFSDGDSLMSARTFVPASDFNTGNYPVSVAVSDLDQDGKPDLITANALSNNISILQNNGRGGNFSFAAHNDLPAGKGPRNIAVGDLNGDGKPDIVVTNFNSGNSGSVSVFRNTSQNGVISFDSATNIQTGNGTVDVAIADINGDGKPDIIVTSGNSAIFSILRNVSAGSGPLSFAPKLDFFSFNHPDHITVSDLDNDGKPDIIVSEFSNYEVDVYRNTSSGEQISLGQPVPYPVGQNPGFLRTGDLDGDGKSDLVVENYGSATISIYKNMSVPGTITLSNRIDTPATATSIAFADLNGDGRLDISFGNYQSGNISVVQNMSSNGGTALSPSIDYKTGNFDTFGNVGDLNGDGRPDLIAVNVLLNTVTILKNNVGSPVIISISDTLGLKGKTIVITGKRFTGATSVSFGSVRAGSFHVVSPTEIDAVVGGGASGDVTVGSASGAGMISGFRFMPEIVFAGSTSICSNSSFLLNSTADSNNQWYHDGVLITGATADSLHPLTSGLYSVKTTSNGITTSSDSGTFVYVISVPVPSISKNADNMLVSSLDSGNQWYRNGSAILGATDKTFEPVQNGLYNVTHSENGCTSDFSSGYDVKMTDEIDLGNGQYARLYPNPATTDLTLKWKINSAGSLNISITDLQGKPVVTLMDLTEQVATINLSALSPGYYLLKMYSSESGINKTVKILKVN